MKIDFRIPILPNPGFYSQVRLIAQSLAQLGPPYSAARILVSVGDRPDPAAVIAANAWSSAYPVEWYVVPEEVYDRIAHPGWASGIGRYTQASDADVVIVCDADTCPIARFDDLLARLGVPHPVVAGLQAHFTPFDHLGLDNDAMWRRLFDAIGRPDALLALKYSFAVEGRPSACPAYFNYGFVAFNRPAFAAVAQTIFDMMTLVCRLLPRLIFSAQVALSLAIIRCNIDVISLAQEFNCANDDLLLSQGLVDPTDIRVVHYMRTGEFDRSNFLCDRDKFEAFIGAEKQNAISERLRQHVLRIPEAFKPWT